MNYRQAKAITGGLSYPSKMPCPSWGLSANNCKTGGKLAKSDKTACSICYAKRHHYLCPSVKGAHERRLAGIGHPEWVEAMTIMIGYEADDYFRWFDSGDVQGRTHLMDIIQVAKNLPNVKFWMPTQEHALVALMAEHVPDNLLIRFSARRIDNPPKSTTAWPYWSYIFTKEYANENTLRGTICNAKEHHGKCGKCRACWSKETALIGYPRR